MQQEMEQLHKKFDAQAAQWAHKQVIHSGEVVRDNFDYSKVNKRNHMNIYVNDLWIAQDKVLNKAINQCYQQWYELQGDHNNCRYLVRLRDHLMINGRPWTTAGDALNDPTIPDELMVPPKGWRRVV